MVSSRRITRWARMTLVAVAASAGAGLSVSPFAQQQPTFRSGVDTIAIYATVTDRDGRLVPGLPETDFQVFDDGRQVAVSLFSNDPKPATIALMLDMSESIIKKMWRLRDATRRLVQELHPDDRVRVGTFGEEIAISPHLTGDQELLARILQEELWPGGPTPLWNALSAGMTSLEGESGRRVVLSLTDGNDSGGLPGWEGTRDQVSRRAIDQDFMFYAIGMEGSGLDGRLVQLSDETGGGHFELKDDAALGQTFARVIDELRHQYVFGFVPHVRDGRLHKLEVRPLRQGLTVRARKSYLSGIAR